MVAGLHSAPEGILTGVEVPKRIEVESGTRVVLTWGDDTTTELHAPELRAACRCATCRQPAGIAATKAVLAGPVKVEITETKQVGGYALNFVFAPEGHGTGIYSFDVLRTLGDGGSLS